MTHIITARNVNDAFAQFVQMDADNDLWHLVAPRGRATKEFYCPVVTEYGKPMERVLFHQARDANPFFHFFESLWILAGRRDVEFISQFNPRMRDFSDNGRTFHAAYGHRLRNHFKREDAHGYIEPVDQIGEVVALLTREPDTRRAVLNLWDPAADLSTLSKDIPCNDTVFFKLRENNLNMTVCCRSNDIVWGAYGTNAVQFSMIQEVVARAIGVGVGVYRQISDSFHVYTDEPAYLRSIGNRSPTTDPYAVRGLGIEPFPLFENSLEYADWMFQLENFIEHGSNLPVQLSGEVLPFFTDVAIPMLLAWRAFKEGMTDPLPKNDRIEVAQKIVSQCMATDWQLACHRWLERRRES